MSKLAKFFIAVSLICNVVLGILYTKEYTEYSTFKTYAPYMYKVDGFVNVPPTLPELEVK